MDYIDLEGNTPEGDAAHHLAAANGGKGTHGRCACGGKWWVRYVEPPGPPWTGKEQGIGIMHTAPLCKRFGAGAWIYFVEVIFPAAPRPPVV